MCVCVCLVWIYSFENYSCLFTRWRIFHFIWHWYWLSDREIHTKIYYINLIDTVHMLLIYVGSSVGNEIIVFMRKKCDFSNWKFNLIQFFFWSIFHCLEFFFKEKSWTKSRKHASLTGLSVFFRFAFWFRMANSGDVFHFIHDWNLIYFSFATTTTTKNHRFCYQDFYFRMRIIHSIDRLIDYWFSHVIN